MTSAYNPDFLHLEHKCDQSVHVLVCDLFEIIFKFFQCLSCVALTTGSTEAPWPVSRVFSACDKAEM